MLDGGIGLLGSLATGGGLGLLKLAGGGIVDLIKSHIQAKKEQDIATREGAKEFFTTVYNQKPVEAELEGTSKFSITLFGKEFGFERTYKKEKLFVSYLAWCYGTSMLLLICIIGAVTLIWADNPGVILWASDPTTEPTKVGFGWGLVNFVIAAKAKVQEYTTGGVAYMLVHGLVGLTGYMVIGQNPFQRK